MLRRAAVLVVLACCAPCVQHLPAAPVPTHLMPKEPPCFYPTAVGTTWVYDCGGGRTETWALAKVEEKHGAKLLTTEFVLADGTRSHHMTLSVGDKGVYLVAERGATYEKPWCICKLPHKEGDAWQTEGHGADMASGPLERLKTPAGEFTAVRVDWGVNGATAKYWYAQGVGLVRMSGGATLDLKSFTPGKP